MFIHNLEGENITIQYFEDETLKTFTMYADSPDWENLCKWLSRDFQLKEK